ncbi:hypothetical protein J7384_16175 [Endozoicomonas sp. G2_1]|nr:hypothetical protein [Endozoicomonas sp. G2_1]
MNGLFIPKPPQDACSVGIKSDLGKALITPDILSFAEASLRLFKNVPDIFVQRMVAPLLKSITQYKSLLNQSFGRFTGTYSHRCS